MKLHQVTNSSPILWLFLNCQSLEKSEVKIAGNMQGCLKMVNPEGFRHSGFLNARAEADVRHCSCLKHLHSEVRTAVHNDERVYFACTCSLADNTQRMRMHGVYVMPDKETLCIHGRKHAVAFRAAPLSAWSDNCAEKAGNLIIHFIKEKPLKNCSDI